MISNMQSIERVGTYCVLACQKGAVVQVVALQVALFIALLHTANP